MLTFTTLASGSSGNAALVSCGDTHILLDAGISAKRLTQGLRALGTDPARLAAILITHEHSDHIGGLAVLTRKLRIPILATGPTCKCIAYRVPFVEDLLRPMEPGSEVQIGALAVRSFPTPHDAAGSVGYRISGDGGTMALCTDLGHVTPEVKRAVQGCGLLVCEANHDVDWLLSGPYPYHTKQRILGDNGHLSNEAGAGLAAFGAENGVRAVVLAHLSARNNTPARARAVAVARLQAMGAEPGREIDLTVAPRNEAGPTFQVERGAVAREGGTVLCGTYS